MSVGQIATKYLPDFLTVYTLKVTVGKFIKENEKTIVIVVRFIVIKSIFKMIQNVCVTITSTLMIHTKSQIEN